MFKNALVSVANKKGLVEFLLPLVKNGLRVLSTGGTARHLKEHGIEVIDVSEQTGFAEVMDGRVKTLHPKVHMSLLARQGNEQDQKTLKDYKIEAFDLVIGNLYPFEESVKKGIKGDELLEFIDIGGPSFLRAAAKNYKSILTICDIQDYSAISSLDSIGDDVRKKMAGKVFQHTAHYDSLIAQSLLDSHSLETKIKNAFVLKGDKVNSLRYGENPQQKSTWYKNQSGDNKGLHQAKLLHGKELSYNNICDLDAAVCTLRNIKGDAVCVSVKHNNPCGIAVSENPLEAVKKSLSADPVSVFGGVIAINKMIDVEIAKILSEIFVECVVAIDFTKDALDVLMQKKNIRLLKWTDMMASQKQEMIKTVDGGFLVQDADNVETWSEDWRVVVGSEPSATTKLDLSLAWAACAHLKSNAISLVRNGQTVGLGMGQVNRVDAVKQAVARMNEFHTDLDQVVLASDAFFPFADSIDYAAKAGVKWIIQPGGSINDDKVIKRAKELNVNVVLTGKRHFMH